MRGLRIGYGPALGVYALDYQLETSGTATITVNLGTTQASGSTIVAGLFGRFSSLGVVSDNKTNTYTLAQSGSYAGGLWPGFGVEVYTCANASGGASHTIQATKASATTEEVTLLGVEVRGGTTVSSATPVAVAASGAGVTLNGPSLSVTGRNILISIWTGDGGVATDPMDADPASPWILLAEVALEEAQAPNGHIQAAVAYREVTAGTYQASWVPQANQGGIISLVAVKV